MTIARDDTQQGRPGIAPPPWAGPKAGRSARVDKPQLSREAIVEAAMRIIDGEGLDAVSMRRIAQEFGTGAASLYAYVANKDELLDLVFDWVMREVADRLPDTEPTAENWRELARDLIRVSREVLSSHRDVARAFLGRAPFGPNGLRIIEAQLGIMRAGGVPDHIAAFTGDLIGSFLVAGAIDEDMWRVRFPEAGQREFDEQLAQIRDYLAELPADRFPNVVALAGPLVEQQPEGYDRFDLGLEVLLRGIASFVADAGKPAGGGEAP
jgi:TetR/AcrR family tetracycline transcriptional repressor